MRRLLILSTCLLLASCSPSSFEEFQTEGEALTRQIIEELQKVQTTEQLLASAPRLKKRFSTLVELMIEAREFQEAHPEEWSGEKTLPEGTFNELLMIELERVHKLERGKEIVEGAQREALHRLDAYELNLKRRKEKLRVTHS